MEYPSKLIEEAVNEVSRLPGIGKKTALRLVLYVKPVTTFQMRRNAASAKVTDVTEVLFAW
jgi:recombinational DNA repair protein RecR